MSDWLGLSGRAAVVTGAGGGIGKAIALELSTNGVHCNVLDRAGELVDATVAEIKASGGSATGFVCDVTKEDEVTSVAASIKNCDILVNAAGLVRPGALADLTTVEWNDLLKVNLTGYFLMARSFTPALVASGNGAMIHVASISSTNPQGSSGAYSVSKAGVVIMSKQLAFELGPQGVRSNTVSPGLVRTPMTEAYYQVGDVAQRRDAAVPVGRVAKPDDIADVVTFLASDRARYITGADLVADGGFSQTLMSSVPRPGFGD
ncbi:MAG: SDR family NAD(P)-dependent oxidoreductase [Actinobacteria bacterium]|nr:SDR family NAD(P)-dependent oxidoreductase [Actinomycetota bacterium]